MRYLHLCILLLATVTAAAQPLNITDAAGELRRPLPSRTAPCALCLWRINICIKMRAGDGCVSGAPETFELGLAIGSVFVIFFASLLGASLPAIVSLTERPWISYSIKLMAYSGAGVLICTGFVHLLLPAQEALSNPCLPSSFLAAYPSWAFLFCVTAIMAMQILDFFVASWAARSAASGLNCSACAAPRDEESGDKVATRADTSARVSAVVVSEASVAVHSLLIGLALGTTGRGEFLPLFIALIFHQLLEGVALGSTAVQAGLRTRTVLFLAILFAATTPLGTAIGIAVRRSFNPDSAQALLVVGTLDAVCAGMLISLALGDHINAVKSQAGWLRDQSTATTASCMAAFVAGVAVMSAIGIWA